MGEKTVVHHPAGFLAVANYGLLSDRSRKIKG
jgi:hypothetical protein